MNVEPRGTGPAGVIPLWRIGLMATAPGLVRVGIGRLLALGSVAECFRKFRDLPGN